MLLIASYVFYMAWSPVLIFLIWTSTLVDFWVARKIAESEDGRARKLLLVVSLAVNLGLLSYFKYADFLLQSFSELISLIGIHYQAPQFNILLPIGISFYTFQTLSYTIDIYRRKLAPTNSLLDFSLFVTFFPQLVAGPIVRAVDFLPQCEVAKRVTKEQLLLGSVLFIFGILLKTVFADSFFAPVVDGVYNNVEAASAVSSWLAIFSFSMQIYCDFAAYSICAIAVAIMLGFALPINFNSPYAATGFSDFWQRWHISLSSWLRDYLYISLGGNKWGKLLTFRNLIITMALGGLWHGASIGFMLWGLLHGLFLVLEHGLKRFTIFIPKFVLVVVTFVIVSLLWIPFRSTDYSIMISVFQSLFEFTDNSSITFDFAQWQALVGVILVFTCQVVTRNLSLADILAKIPYPVQSILVIVALFFIGFYSSGDSNAFIYFQF